MSKTGKLSINSENMLPIIKKWLYSDHDLIMIFLYVSRSQMPAMPSRS